MESGRKVVALCGAVSIGPFDGQPTVFPIFFTGNKVLCPELEIRVQELHGRCIGDLEIEVCWVALLPFSQTEGGCGLGTKVVVQHLG